MDEFRPDLEQNEDDVLAYVDDQGYTDFRDCCDHALAVLRFAEKLQLRELWIDSFVHCAGMWEQLDMSPEFEVSNFGIDMLDNFLMYTAVNLSSFASFDLSSSP